MPARSRSSLKARASFDSDTRAPKGRSLQPPFLHKHAWGSTTCSSFGRSLLTCTESSHGPYVACDHVKEGAVLPSGSLHPSSKQLHHAGLTQKNLHVFAAKTLWPSESLLRGKGRQWPPRADLVVAESGCVARSPSQSGMPCCCAASRASPQLAWPAASASFACDHNAYDAPVLFTSAAAES